MFDVEHGLNESNMTESPSENDDAAIKMPECQVDTAVDEDEYVRTIKQLENCLGEMFTTIDSIDNTKDNDSVNSLEHERTAKNQVEDELAEIPAINRDVLRLSLKMNGRPGTPTRPTPSLHSDADSGIAISPAHRKPDLSRMPSWTRSILEEDNPFLRSSSSFVFDHGGKLASPIRHNRSFHDGFHGRESGDGYERASMRSLAVPMGHTDGTKVIYKTDALPMLLNLPSFEDPYDPRGSFQRSTTGSLDDYRRPHRAQWANKAQFILACVGYSVGLGNIWRFPYVCYKSGGGAFLVPYLLALVVCGIPLMYMELAIGQFTHRGPIGALGKLCPIMKGAGLSSVVISFIMSTYFSVIIAYSLYYFFSSFKSSAPWNSCDNVWNTPECWMPSRLHQDNITRPNVSRTPSQEFYENKVLQMTAGIEDLGILRWELAACLIVAWILVYFSIWKSVKSSGKVLYFTATFPYVIILAFLIKSLTLEGADQGLKYLFKPKWELLADSHVWVNAVGQVFTSIGLAFGSIVSFASYNKRENKILVDTLAVTLINAFTSLMVAVFAFAVIGNIAAEHDMSIDNVITDGPGLVFVVYPQAMAKMPASQAWSILFFFMLLCLGLNTQEGMTRKRLTIDTEIYKLEE